MKHQISETVIRSSRHWLAALAVILISLGTAQLVFNPSFAVGQQTKSSSLKIPTLGGTQFWTDQMVLHDWRIQRNQLTKHCRLLDGKNYRHTWGTFEHCQGTLQKLQKQLKLPAVKGKVVIVLHGLGRTRNSMNTITQYLRKQSDYTVLSMSYASTRAEVQDHAQALAQVIKGLPQAKEINFVAHSLGRKRVTCHTHPWVQS